MADKQNTTWEDFTPGPGDKPLQSAPAVAAQDATWGEGDKPAPASLLRKAGDLGLSVAKGVIAVPEAAVGLADIATGGAAGKFLENEGGAFGFRPKQAKEILSGWQSDDLQGKQREFQQADGIIDKAKVALSNPSLVTNAVAESVPLMGAGAVPARAVMAVAPKVGALAAGAIGEGVAGAGSAAEQVRQETADGLLTPKQAGLAAASGAATAAFGMAGGKLAQRLGIGDVDTMLAQGAAKTAGMPSAKSIPRQVVEGAISEGWLEELPQSVAEQILQNLALNKPWSEGVEDAAVMGTLAGMAMGGTAAGVSGFKSEPGAEPPPAAPTEQPPAQPTQGGPMLALPAPPRGTIQVGSDGTARTPAYQTPGYVGDAAVTDVVPKMVDPVREAVAVAAENGGALSGAALTAIDTGASQTMQPQVPDAPPAAPISLEEADARDQAAYEQFFDSLDSDPVVSRYFEDDTDIPDFGAASNVSDEEFLRALGATDEDIQDAIATASQSTIPQSSPAVDAGAQANEPAGPRQGAGAAQATQGQVAPRQPDNFTGTPTATVGQPGAIARPGPGFGLKDALAQIRAKKQQEAANAKATETPAPTATTAPGPAATSVEAAGVAAPNIKAITAKQIPDMTADELQLAIEHYGPEHKRTAKLQKEVQRRAAQTTQGSTNANQADQAQQASTPPAQAAAAPAAESAPGTGAPSTAGASTVRALTDGAPTANTGAQAAPAAGAQAAAPAESKEQRAQRVAAAGEAWTRMPSVEREALAARADGLNPIQRKNVAKTAWADLAGTIQRKLADAMQPAAEEGKPVKNSPSAQPSAPAALTEEPAAEVVHNGTRIYPSQVKLGDEVKSMWAVESPDNQRRRAAGERTIGGDSLHDTIEHAKAAAEREAKRDAEQQAAKAEQDAADKARLDAEEARKAVNRPKTVVERRKDAILDGPSKIGQGTKRAVITSAVDNGYAIEAKMAYDYAAKKRDQEAVDRASRAGYILGVSNENLPLVKAGNEAKARLKEDKYEKPEYRVYQGSDTKAPFREITKTEYDYAQELKAQRAAAQQAEAAQPTTQQQDGSEFLPEGWTKSVNGFTKRPVYRMEQGVGQPFAVVTQTEGMTYEVQIRHGDKQLTTGTQRGALSEVLAAAEAELGRMTQADSVTHADPGEKAEAATPSVVTDSLKKAARNEDTKPSEMRKWLVAEIDKELLQAPDRADYDEAVKRLGEKDAISGYTGNGPFGKNNETGYITFDVPGDGKYKVRNSVRGLLEFRKNVMASQGFKDSGQKRVKPEQNDGVQGGSGGNMAAITNMVEEGDFEAARDYAEAVGVSLEDVKVPRGDMKTAWEKFLKDGTLPPAPDTRPKPAPKTAAQLDEEKRQAEEAEARKPKDTGWNMAGVGYAGKRYTGRNITLDDGRDVVARIYENAGRYNEVEIKVDGVRKFTVTDEYNAEEKADAFLKTLTDGTAQVGKGKLATPEKMTSRQFDAWIRERATKQTEQFTGDRNHGGGDEGVGYIYLSGAVEAGGTNWAGTARGAQDKRDARLIFRTDDNKIVWFDDDSQQVYEVEKDDPRLEITRAEPQPKKASNPQEITVTVDGSDYTVMFDEPLATISNQAFQDNLDEYGTPGVAKAEFRRLRAEAISGKAEAAPEAATGARRDPAKVSMFNPYNDGDIVTIGGKDWTVKQDTPGWYLTTTGNWRGQHPTIRNIKAMADLIREVEQAAAAPAAQPDAPKLTTAEAKALMEWQDLGQKDGVKTHILTFYESQADKDAKRGRMTLATITKGERSATNWMVEGEDKPFAVLGMAKKRAEEVGMARAVSDGFVEMAVPAAAVDTSKPRNTKEGIAKASDKKAADAESSKPITDFGEKIGGAKKDLWTGFKDGLTAVADADITSQPLSKIWPAPDYQAMIDGGASPEVMAFVRAARDEVPAKPRVAYKVKAWAGKVQLLRSMAVDLMDGKLTMAQVRSQMEKSGALNRSMQGFMGRVDLYQAVGHQKSLEGIRLAWHNYALYKGQENVSLWVVEKDAAASAFGNWPSELATGKTKEDAIEAFRKVYDKLDSDKEAKKGVQFDIISFRGESGYWIAKKLGRNHVKVHGPLATVKEAREYRDQNQSALVEKLAKLKEIPNERRDVNEPRVGADMRNGADVTPELFSETFGFRGVEFGNWVEQGRRQQDLNNAFDALMDMAAVLGIPPKAISLNGELGLAFGARGTGGAGMVAAAHYESDKVVINLTKKNGAGSLGHEWWHAVDNYFAKQRKVNRGSFMTTGTDVGLAARGKDYFYEGGIRQEMIDAFGAVVKAINQTSMKKRSAVLDGKRSKEYWTTGEELSARAFEAYLIAKLQDQNASNDYLANILSEGAWEAAAALGLENENSYPYPTDSELPSIRAGFDQFFQTVQTKETDKGVAMYRAPDSAAPARPLSLDRVNQLVQEALAGIRGAPPVEVAVRPSDIGLQPPPGSVGYGVTLSSGDIYVFQSAMASDLDVFKTVFHELFHRGVRVLVPKAQYVQTMLDLAKGDTRIQRLAIEWKNTEMGQKQKDNLREQGYTGAELTAQYEALAIEEALAAVAEEIKAEGKLGSKPKNMTIRFLANWLAKIADLAGMKKLAQHIRNMTYNEAERFVMSAIDRSGEPVPRSGTANARSKDVQEGVNYRSADLRSLKASALDQIHQTLTHPGKLSLWDKTVGTMRHLAERAPAFKPVFESAQRFIDDVSTLANEAADAAPRLLPRVETLGDLKKKPITAADNKAIARPLFEGTLMWGRDVDGKAVLVDDLSKKYANMPAAKKAQMLLATGRIQEGTLKMWQGLPLAQYETLVNSRFENQMLKPGVVWTDAELKDLFNATPEQISLYREARQAIDRSIDLTARADMLRAMGADYAAMRDAIMEAPTLNDAMVLATEVLQADARENPDSADRLMAANNQVVKRYEDATGLQEKGYAPLSRFGRYTVDVVDAAGERQYFGMFESMREANQMAAKMRSVFPGAAVTSGTMSQEAYKLFAGITPETLEQFGNMLGLQSEGNEAQDKAFQEYIKLAKNNHSALKRLIHRQGIDGYSEDVGRVLASFVYSNARQAAGGLNAGTMENAINAIPKEQGELKDVAMGLQDYIANPQEEGQAVRGMLFAQYLGGSVASAFVNMTQPFAVTMPYLSQFGGMRKASAQLARAIKDVGAKEFKGEPDLTEALRRAVDDGTVAPQEIHQLMAQARGTGSLRVGDGTKLGDARAAVANNWERVKVAWGQPFALAEQFNRRSTFIAAYRIAKEQGQANPGDFARKAVLETQFLYSKANKARWARGAVGGTLMTFKTYSVSYLELLQRTWNAGTPGSPERAAGRRAVAWAVVMLMLMGGAGGLPFAEDAEDLIDGIGQLMGYNVSAKQWRKELLRDTLGKELGDFVNNGVSGLPGAPVDVSGRLGMGNLIPGTGLFLNKPNRERDLLEVAGPAGDLVARGFTGARKLLTGDVGGAALELSPSAVRNAAKGIDMASSGIYKDAKGYKVLDTTLAEAAAKFVGFQPRSVAEVQEANAFMLRSKSFYSQTSSEIKAQWAKAIFDKDQAALEQVRERLAAWNRNNPDQKIVVKMPDVLKRVREMGKDRTQRIADTAPKALRQQMREEAANVKAGIS